MARLGWRQAVGVLLVWALFAPVILATGSESFRLAIYRGAVLGVPAFPALVLALLVVLLALVWVFAGAAFSDGDAEGGERP